ncbi:hypothetical protein A4X06_0g4670 [Tilletia controversa]|uniref:Uncharacterized protein n=1 Tax=Tilletia controversa TaxID=13291 RepID=A0A8X7SWL2_9BASI|nr:hypothetical protein CF328_g4972 [Tilletia controversa]KAE8247144.1 hypothetical protein A4X06_0g4670 [Tilletia controversa]
MLDAHHSYIHSSPRSIFNHFLQQLFSVIGSMSSTTITITITTTQPDHDTLKDSFLALGHVVFGRDGKADSNVVMKTEAPAKETTLTIPHFTGLVGAAADDDATSAAAAPAQPSYGLNFLNKQPELNGAAPPVLDPKK